MQAAGEKEREHGWGAPVIPDLPAIVEAVDAD